MAGVQRVDLVATAALRAADRFSLFAVTRMIRVRWIVYPVVLCLLVGVRVTVAAGRLQDSGAISYVRGHIQILDRQVLEATVCECYRVVKDEFDRLLG